MKYMYASTSYVGITRLYYAYLSQNNQLAKTS